MAESDSDKPDKEERAERSLIERLAPTTSLRSLKQIIESYGKIDTSKEEKKRVLDPQHPLMIKFQKDLREHLLKLHRETDVQLLELTKAVRDQTQSNDEVGKEMCALQKELLSAKEQISSSEKSYKKLLGQREKTNIKLDQMRLSHKTLQEQLQLENNNDLKLRKQVENLSLQVVQLKQLHLESFSESSTNKGALEKSAKDRENLEIEKLRQDLLIATLEEEQIALQDKINLYKSQSAIKKEELSDLQKILGSALADMEAMHFEKLQLMQQWNHSISSLEKRDYTAVTMRDAVKKLEDEIRTTNMDIKNHKKLLRKELENNEKLTGQLLQKESDVAMLQNLLQKCKTRQRNLEEQCSFFDQVVQHTEKELDNLGNEKVNHEQELALVTKKFEKACNTIKAMEAEYVKVVHEKISVNKASVYNEKKIKECKKQIENLESKTLAKHAEEAKLKVKYNDVLIHLQAMDDNLAVLKKEYEEKEKTIAKCEAEISREHVLIEKKQVYILELNKKLSTLISEAGGMELGPMEREISNIKKEIINCEKARKVMEQEWMRYQRELVTITNEASALSKEINMLYKKEAVLEKKKITIGADLNKEENEIKDLSRSAERIQNDMRRLMAVLYHEKDYQEQLEQQAQLLKGDFLKLLKDAEVEFARKEKEVSRLRQKRAEALQRLVQVQRECMMWEGKLQIVEEAQKILKSEVSANEIACLKSEIKRLQVRCEQIKKEEGNLIQQMERAAFHHATLYVKADIQAIRGVKKKTKHYLSTKTERLTKKLQEDKKKLESILEEISNRNNDIYEFKRLEEQQNSKIADLVQQIKVVDYDLEKKAQEKCQSAIRLSCEYKKNQLLQKLKEGKYIWATRKPELRAAEIERLYGNLRSLQEITNHVLSRYPDLKEKLLRVLDYTFVGFQF